MWVSWLTGFLAGFLCLALIEVCTIAFFLKHFLDGHRRPSSSPPAPPADIASVSYQPPHISLKGEIWVAALPASVLKKDNIKIVALRVTSKDTWRRKEISDDCVEICPSRRHACLENNILALTSENGIEKRIEMRGCKVLSVSGGKEESRKWAKKYPIQLESFDQESSVWLLYLETSWAKETWCQVLRAAAESTSWTSEKGNLYTTHKRDFHKYCAEVEEGYPAFAKGFGSKTKRLFEDEKGAKIDRDAGPGLSKKQKFWRRVTKKGSVKVNATTSKEVTETEDSSTGVLMAKSPNRQDDLSESQFLSEGSLGNESTGSSSFRSNLESVWLESTNSMPDLVKSIDDGVLQQDVPTTTLDQGTMCWNIICSRLFFDGYHSSRFQEACHKFIQKQFAKIVTPAYMGNINCTKLELGSKPPMFHSMQVNPKHSDYIWSFDAVVEYSGDAQIKIDTHLDVRDSVSQENVVNQSLEPTLAGAAAADMLRKGLETVMVNSDGSVVRVADTEAGVSGSEKAQSSKGRLKAMLARVADQVSSIPITMSLKLVSLKGTLRIQIKPPPTDRIWFCFTSKPTVQLEPAPFIGDRKITTGLVINFITNRIMMLIQDTLVLPNCEGIWVPWMISDAGDWLPVTARPVPWSPLDPHEETQPPKDVRVRSSAAAETRPGGKLGTIISGSEECGDLHELEKPLLRAKVSESEYEEPSATLDATSTPSNVRLWSVNSTDSGDAGNRSSRRAKILNLGKKVTGKFDETRRFMVDRMREMEKHDPGAR